MAILGFNPSDADKLGISPPEQPGQGGEVPAEVPPRTPGTEDRPSEAPKGEEAVPRPPYKGRTIGQYAGNAPKPPKVGYPCKNCSHTHIDHSMYGPRKCLLCDDCSGLIMDHNLIPSKLE